jgi:hypothetical protein
MISIIAHRVEFRYGILVSAQRLVALHGPVHGVWLCCTDGSVRRAWLCAMAQYIEFGYAVWASGKSLVMRYGPVHKVWLCCIGQCTEFGYALWPST